MNDCDEMESLVKIRKTTLNDCSAVKSLYLKVAKKPGGIARQGREITDSYVHKFIETALLRGISQVIINESGIIVGEIHASRSGLVCFSHVLSDLTIAIDPDVQSQGLGRMLFESFMETVVKSHPGILRVELFSRASNSKAISFYESLGFVQEGAFHNRVMNHDGSMESDIPMAWVRANQDRSSA